MATPLSCFIRSGLLDIFDGAPAQPRTCHTDLYMAWPLVPGDVCLSVPKAFAFDQTTRFAQLMSDREAGTLA